MTRLDDTKAYYQRGTHLLEAIRKHADTLHPHEDGVVISVRLNEAKELAAYVDALEADRVALLVGFRWLGGMLHPEMRITEEQKKLVTRAYAIEEVEDR